MKLKEIKPGMVIHCKSLEEMKVLLEYIGSDRSPEHIWNDEDSFGRVDCINISPVRGAVGYSSFEFYKTYQYEITEFSDLVLPELSAEEVLEMIKEICDESSCSECPLHNGEDRCFYKDDDFDSKEIIKACEQWKAEREKKEPEVEMEWFWQGVIFQIRDRDRNNYYQISDGTGFYDTGCKSRESAEEYMAKELKEYCKSHEGDYIAVVQHVCRVKAVE